MIVMKFGGSSVNGAECMARVAALVERARPSGVLVVLSAMGKTTDALFAAARLALRRDLGGALALHQELARRHRETASALFEGPLPETLHRSLEECLDELELLLRGVALLGELSARTMDAIASTGERLSSMILAAFLRAPWVDARTVIATDDSFGAARPQVPEIRARAGRHIAPLLGPGAVAVTQGYIGATAEGHTTTLGRGGSDYSASLFGAALGAEEIQVWTDVEGVLTGDPRVVAGARPIPQLSFAEAAELAAFGAKVLHPATMEPAVAAGIPITVRHTQVPEGRFTRISEIPAAARPVAALASRGPLAVLTLESPRMLHQSGFLARIFDVFRRMRVSVDVVATAEVSVSLTVEQGAPLAALEQALSEFATVKVAVDRALIALVGEKLQATPGIPGKAFGALQDLDVEMISMGASETNLSIVVRREHEPAALHRLHAAFFEGQP